MRQVSTAIALAGLVTASAATMWGARLGAQAPPPSPVTFSRDIQPILESRCLSCHGDTMAMSKLDLRTREGVLSGGAHGAVVVSGSAEQSKLYRVVAGLEKPSMPMQGAPLRSAEIATVKRWIDQGIAWDTDRPLKSTSSTASLAALERRTITAEERSYWAFKLPVQAPVPSSAGGSHSHPIDRFLEKTRTAHGLTAAPRADRLTLGRRAYLDLLGLPPTPAEVAEFMSDRSPQAWEHLIDKLLASPHYGERYGRLWLDVARYADSAGFEYDMHRPNAWRYRDYVIRAFNEDRPFDRFLVEQIAGDEVNDRSDETRIATGFLRAGARVLFREKDNPERRFDYLDEIIGTIAKGT